MDERALAKSLESILQSQLLAAASTILYQDGNFDVTLADRLRSDAFASSTEIQNHIYSLALPIAHALADDLRFSELYGAYCDLGTGPCALRLEDVATALFRVAIIDGVKRSIKWLFLILETSSADGWIVQTIWGICPLTEIHINENISLVPIDSVPDSLAKGMLYGFSSTLVKTAFDYAAPQAALLYRSTVSKVLIPKNKLNLEIRSYSGRKNRSDVSLHFESVCSGLCEIAYLIGVLEPGISIPGPSWFIFTDRHIELFRVTVKSRFETLEVHPASLSWNRWLNAVAVVDIVKKYLIYPKSPKEKINVAIERLSLALRRRDPAEKAVEISIALEALLSDGENNEISHKVRTRAVRLLGGTIRARRRNNQIIKITYEMRSKLVHAGLKVAKSKNIDGEAFTPIEICNVCINLCSRIVLDFINAGALPVWADFDISN